MASAAVEVRARQLDALAENVDGNGVLAPLTTTPCLAVSRHLDAESVQAFPHERPQPAEKLTRDLAELGLHA